MSKRSISRGIMLIAGFIAVCSILLSPTFSNTKSKDQAKTEQSEKPGPTIQAPTEAIPGTAVKMDEPATPVVATVVEEVSEITRLAIPVEYAARFLKILFRTIIAPNAP